MSEEELKASRLAHKFIEAYKESYPSLTVKYVKERIKRLQAGQEAENVIDMFLADEIK